MASPAVTRGAWRTWLAAGLVLLAALLLGQAAYIPAKAWLAQMLLEYAWAGSAQRPWPWADMRPVAALLQPRLGVRQIVLDNASGRSLAFGPGHVIGSARPGQAGNVVISGHRDTHFRWLAEVVPGDRLRLEDAEGGVRDYVVEHGAVHHASDSALLDPWDGDQLRLITCYPFDALLPGTAWRYVLSARPAAL